MLHERRLSEFVACQDINNTATPMLMRDAIHRSYIPSMEALLETLRGEVQTSQANTEILPRWPKSSQTVGVGSLFCYLQKFIHTSQVVVWDFSTINSFWKFLLMDLFKRKCFLQGKVTGWILEIVSQMILKMNQTSHYVHLFVFKVLFSLSLIHKSVKKGGKRGHNITMPPIGAWKKHRESPLRYINHVNPLPPQKNNQILHVKGFFMSIFWVSEASTVSPEKELYLPWN